MRADLFRLVTSVLHLSLLLTPPRPVATDPASRFSSSRLHKLGSSSLDERTARIHTALAGGGDGKASMLQDAQARRKTEVEVINGAIARAGAELGIPVPLNETMVALIHGMEEGWRQ